MALNRKTFKKVAAAADAALVPSENFNTVLYTGTEQHRELVGISIEVLLLHYQIVI